MVKTINQLLCGVHIAVAGEAMALANRAGLDLQAVWDVVNFSAAGSWMLNDRGPRMIARPFFCAHCSADASSARAAASLFASKNPNAARLSRCVSLWV